MIYLFVIVFCCCFWGEGVCVGGGGGGNTALLPFMIPHMFPINFSDTEKLCI